MRMVGHAPTGFPHSDIPESSAAHASSELFAVYHVLLRRHTPRHPLPALTCLLTAPRVVLQRTHCGCHSSRARCVAPFVVSRPRTLSCSLLLLSCTALRCRNALDRCAVQVYPQHGCGQTSTARPFHANSPAHAPSCLFCSAACAHLLPTSSSSISRIFPLPLPLLYRCAPCPSRGCRPVEIKGLEPLTYALQRRRSPN